MFWAHRLGSVKSWMERILPDLRHILVTIVRESTAGMAGNDEWV
jgi:hypothetical protein